MNHFLVIFNFFQFMNHFALRNSFYSMNDFKLGNFFYFSVHESFHTKISFIVFSSWIVHGKKLSVYEWFHRKQVSHFSVHISYHTTIISWMISCFSVQKLFHGKKLSWFSVHKWLLNGKTSNISFPQTFLLTQY